MKSDKKQMIREFVFDQLTTAKEIQTECEKLSDNVLGVRLCTLYIETAIHSLETLKKHVDQWHVSDKAIELILNTVVELCEGILQITNNREELEPIDTPASMICIMIRSCYSGPMLG